MQIIIDLLKNSEPIVHLPLDWKIKHKKAERINFIHRVKHRFKAELKTPANKEEIYVGLWFVIHAFIGRFATFGDSGRSRNTKSKIEQIELNAFGKIISFQDPI